MTSDTPTNTATSRDWPHRIIRRSDTVRPLPPHTRSLADLTVEVGGCSLSVSDCMTRCRTTGVLILKGGEIALERYGMESDPGRRREGYSTTKSIVATLVGAALHDGAIGSLDDCCDLYVPRLRGSAYEGVTVRNVMRMCSGVAWDEEGDGRANTGRLELAWASRQPGSMLDLACSLPRAQPQGTFFNYSTIESSVLGAVVAAATGQTLADYCAEKIWRPAGMEANAYWVLDADGGQETGGFGFSACLRDLGRFGLLALEDGAAFSGRQILPSGWRDLIAQPDSAPTGFGRLTPGSPMGYGYHWWAMPHGPTGIHAGAFLAAGAFGQYVYVHPTARVVAAVQSAWRQHEDPDANAGTWALLGAALRALRTDPA
jgi:CubicO group peptidase (beta-lactamase class C family)